MDRFHSHLLSAVFIILAGAGRGHAEAAPDGARIPPTVTRFPGGAGNVVLQLDRSAICSSTHGVFVSMGDFHRWKPAPGLPPRELYSKFGIPGPGYSLFRAIGGDRTRFFVEGDVLDFEPERVEKQATLRPYFGVAALDAADEFVVVWDRIPSGRYWDAFKLAAFGSRHMGAIAWNESVTDPFGNMLNRSVLRLTIDGGATWKAVPPPILPTRTGIISAMRWVTPSRLLIGSSDASVQMFEHTGNGALRHVWSAKAPTRLTDDCVLLDGDGVWVGTGPINRLMLADGRLDASAPANVPGLGLGGIAACREHLLIWGWDEPPPQPPLPGPNYDFESLPKESAARPVQYLNIWARDGQLDYVRRVRIASPPQIVGVLPLEAPLCLIITAEGEGLHLHLEEGTLSPVALQVTPVPPLPPPPRDPTVPTVEELDTFRDLVEQIPWRARRDLLRPLQKQPNLLMDRQHFDRFIKAMRDYIETEEPGPEVEMEEPQATPEERRTAVNLMAQVPCTVRATINKEAMEKDLSEREWMLWVTEQYRRYLEQNPPDPDKPPVGGTIPTPGGTIATPGGQLPHNPPRDTR